MEKLRDHALVGETRFKGLLGGVEFVADKQTKKPFDPKSGVGPMCIKFLQDRGVILRAIGDTLALCPPMIITEAELNEMFDRLELALNDTSDWITREKIS